MAMLRGSLYVRGEGWSLQRTVQKNWGKVMAGFYGADTDALRDIAGVFEQRSRRLDELRETLHSAVMREEIWIGTDAESFRDRWTGVSSQFSDASEGIERQRADLEDHAEQQDDASDPEGGGFLDSIGDFFKNSGGGVKDLLNGARKIKKGIDAFKFFNDLQKLGKAGYEGLKEMLNSQFIDDLVDKTRKPAQKIMDFVNGKGWNRIADVAEGILDSGVVKGAGKVFGKLLPGLDIGMGIHQIVTAEDGWDVAAGGLSVLSGGLLLAAPLAGPFAPVVAGAGLVAGGISLGIDAGKAIVENWDTITETADKAWEATKDFTGDVVDSVENFVDDPIGSLKSIF